MGPRIRTTIVAESVAIALGLNLWFSLVVLPLHYCGEFWRASTGPLTFGALLVLGWGTWKRSDAALLLGFPAMLLLPLALSPQAIESRHFNLVRMLLVAVSFVAFLFGAAAARKCQLDVRAINSPRTSPLRTSDTLWRRQCRVYNLLSILALLFPIVLIFYFNYSPENLRNVEDNFHQRTRDFFVVVTLIVLVSWPILFFSFFLGPVASQLRGDRSLRTALGRLRIRKGVHPLVWLLLLVATSLTLLLTLFRY